MMANGNTNPRWYYIEFETGVVIPVCVYDAQDALLVAGLRFSFLYPDSGATKMIQVWAAQPESKVDKVKDIMKNIFTKGKG